MKLISRILDRRFRHIEAVVNARSEEQIAAIEELVRRVEELAASHRDLAENVTEVIESHLAFHVQSMTEIGAIMAQSHGLDPIAGDHGSTTDEIVRGA